MTIRTSTFLAALSVVVTVPAFGQKTIAAASSIAIKVQWNDIERPTNTIPTIQYLANALTLRSHPLNKDLLKDLRDLHTDDTRLQLWFSVPNQAVAELKEPTDTKTFWNFRYMDSVVIDYFSNTRGRHHVNIGTIPRWMFKVPSVTVPTDPGATFYAYTKGTRGDLLKDPTGKQFAEYQARIYEWYTQGGFTDELGKYHKSGYHFKIDYWGILNEPNFENKINVEQYTKLWDAVAATIHRIDPQVQFFGPEISGAEASWAPYFLNPQNHKPGALQVQWFTLHNYVTSNNDPATWQGAFFTDLTNKAGFPVRSFADQLREVTRIRDELSPQTQIAIDELGTFNQLNAGGGGGADDALYSSFSPLYWVASGANWVDNFITAEKLGIPLISMTQMVGAPRQSPSCSMINPNTARPNAHYWALSLINEHFGPGNKLVTTTSNSPDVVAQAQITATGQKLLLVNTSDYAVAVDLSGVFVDPPLKVELVDETSGENPPRTERVSGHLVELAPFAVGVVSRDE